MLTEGSVNSVKLISYVLLAIATGARSCEIHSSSPSCKKLQQIELSLDQTVNPCEDFHAHACNNWALQHMCSEFNTTEGLVEYQTNLKLIAVMETLGQQADNPNIFNKSYNYYRSCVNEKVLRVAGYFEVLKPGPGLEWPLMQELRGRPIYEWPVGQFNLFALLGQLHGHGLNNVLIQQNIYRTYKGLAVILVAPSVDKKQTLRLSDLTNLLRTLGLSEYSAGNYARNIKNTEEYWHTHYGQFKSSYMSSRTVRMSHVSLEEEYPRLATFLENILPQHIPDNEICFVDMIFQDYFKFLSNKQWSSQEAQDLANYLMVKFLIHVMDDQAQDLTKLQCIKDLRNHLDFPVNLMYYQYIYQPQELHCNPDISTLSTKALDYLKETVAENHLNFSTSYVSRLGRELSAIKLNMGNFPRNMHPARIEKFFRNIPDLEPQNYYKNHLHLLRHRVLKTLLKFEEQTHFIVTNNRQGRSSTPFYDAEQGMLILPLGNLQPPIYDYTFDPLFKWSMLGFQLAHDYTDAICYSALHDQPAVPFFNCIRQQDNSIASTYKGAPDLVGARVAYRAYVREKSGQLQPNFSNISWKKLFFLNLAQLFCVHNDEPLRQQNAKRLHHIVMNVEGFAEAFQCPVGSKMNPRKKCRFF